MRQREIHLSTIGGFPSISTPLCDKMVLLWKYFHREELKTLYLVHSWTMKRGRGYGFMTWNTDNSENEQSTSAKISRWVIGLCGAAIGIIATIVIGLALPNFFVLPEKVGNLEKKVETIEGNISEIKDSIWEIRLDLAGAGKDSDISITDVVTDSAVAVKLNFLNNRDVPSQTPTVQLAADTVIGYRKGTDIKVTAEEISDCKVLLPYKSGDQDVFFYGQINENGRWDGNCILNTYEGDKLVLITDAVYDNGNLISCKQVFFYNLRSGQEVWAYSDYIRKDGFGSGDTWLYIKESDCIKNLSIDDVAVEDVLSADQFKESFCHNLIAYYAGNTSDGFFNDESGNAYMAYFFEDGSVRLLYCGNFVDGTFNDSTGNAWYIVRNEKTNYMYFKGVFRNGEEVHNSKQVTLPPPLSQEQINEILGDRQFNVSLRWADLNGPLT